MTPTQLYEVRATNGEIKPDAAQQRVLPALDRLQTELVATSQRCGILIRILKPALAPRIRGHYLFGEVGRGKTMLMDLLCDSMTGVPKKRTHFHAFMQQVHALRTKHAGEADIMSRIAKEIAAPSSLLCLDEMQITDIADAMIIGRLFDALIKRNVCIVTTSNLSPEELYKDGLNRQLFLPFIDKLRSNFDVIELQSPLDYRLGRMRTRETWLSPATAANRVTFNAIWNDLTDSDQGHHETLEVLGRKIIAPKVARSCASFTFSELCKEALGSADYLAIAKAYRTIFISGVQKLDTSQRNEAKRFILMIDTFYDSKTRLVALAECLPEEIAPTGQHASEFKRTVSRLKEMQAASWWA